MYVNEKLIPIETITAMRGGRTKENDGGVNSTIVRTFVNVTMYPQYNNNKKYKYIGYRQMIDR
jgi:hypothetical protein